MEAAVDIRVLRYYLAVCREGNMSRAAQVLHVTQPTLSRQIADLERELGCTLLVRGSRTVTPTEKGLYLRRRAEEIVALADQTASELVHADEMVEGDVYIGAGESEGMRHVAMRIRTFRERHPQVRFHVRSSNSIDVIEWLEARARRFRGAHRVSRHQPVRTRASAWCRRLGRSDTERASPRAKGSGKIARSGGRPAYPIRAGARDRRIVAMARRQQGPFRHGGDL